MFELVSGEGGGCMKAGDICFPQRFMVCILGY